MFKFLKNKQKMQSAGVFLVVYTVVFLTVVYLGDMFLLDESEQIDQLDNALTALMEETKLRNESILATLEELNKRADLLLEINELQQQVLEQNKEMFMQLEQRIASLQDKASQADLDSTGLTEIQAEIADILQTLKNINETETADLAE